MRRCASRYINGPATIATAVPITAGKPYSPSAKDTPIMRLIPALAAQRELPRLCGPAEFGTPRAVKVRFCEVESVRRIPGKARPNREAHRLRLTCRTRQVRKANRKRLTQ